MFRIARGKATFVVVLLLLSTCSLSAFAISFTTQYTDGGTWDSIFAQGFKASVSPTPDPGHGINDVVHLDRFQFTKSGATTYNSGNDDMGNPVLVPIPSATNVQLAIVNNLFFDLTTFTTSSSQLIGLSTNTIADVSTIPTGSPISFNFNDLPITYGKNDGDNLGVNCYGAVLVNNNGGTLTPVRVPAIIVNYLAGQNEIQSDYGLPYEYQLSAVGFMHTNSFGTYFDAYNETVTGGHGDADFIASFDLPAGTPGDYDGNGKVDAADYVVWRKNLGNSVTLPNDSTPGTVTQADYDVWKANFGSGAGAGASLSGGAVPEPGTLVLASMAIIALLGIRHRMATT
jgi:hypothetical protein